MSTQAVELANFENWKLLLERSIRNGLADKIPNFGAQVQHVMNSINSMQPNGTFLETDDERRKKGDAATISAAVVMQQQAQISHYAQNGFKTASEFFGFSSNFKDPNFVATLDAMPEEKRKELAQKMVDSYNELDEDKKKKYIAENPEAVAWLKEQGFDLSKNQNLEKIKESVREIGGKKAVEQIGVLEGKNASLDSKVDREKEFSAFGSDIQIARAEQVVAKTNVERIVFDGAKERGLSNLEDDYKKENDRTAANVDDMFASAPMIASAAQKLQKAGMETDTEISAPKPTQVQIADTGKSVDTGRGSPA